MAKVNKSFTIDEKVIGAIEELRKPENEKRSASDMVEILLSEALTARGISLVEKKKKK